MTPYQYDPQRANMAQLRTDIDSGRTGDKVAAIDHAIAPLGTDEEAAGTPVSTHLIAQTRNYECSRTFKAVDSGTSRAVRYWAPVLVGALISLAVIIAIVLNIS